MQKRAVKIVTILTFLVAFFELIFAFTQYQPGITIGDVATYVTNRHHIDLLLLIIANLGVSFIIGLVWIFAYRKTKHLITPMIFHASSGLFYLIWSLLAHA